MEGLADLIAKYWMLLYDEVVADQKEAEVWLEAIPLLVEAQTFERLTLFICRRVGPEFA